MRRLFPWVLSVVLLIALGATFSELQRLRKRFGEVTRHTFHDHQDVREFIIRSALAEVECPVVVVGDSITEMAPLPREIAGRPVVNAGIGGMRTPEFIALAPRLLGTTTPCAIVVALGANDIGSQRERDDMLELISTLRHWTTHLVAVSVTSDTAINRQIGQAATLAEISFVETAVSDDLKMDDKIHFTAKAYGRWIPRLVSAIEGMVAPE